MPFLFPFSFIQKVAENAERRKKFSKNPLSFSSLRSLRVNLKKAGHLVHLELLMLFSDICSFIKKTKHLQNVAPMLIFISKFKALL